MPTKKEVKEYWVLLKNYVKDKSIFRFDDIVVPDVFDFESKSQRTKPSRKSRKH